MTTQNMKWDADVKSAGKPHAAAGDQVRDQAHGPAQGPMPQQSAFGAHGYDIHPQKFVRLVGCRQPNAA
jgi:hypothetical protein